MEKFCVTQLDTEIKYAVIKCKFMNIGTGKHTHTNKCTQIDLFLYLH